MSASGRRILRRDNAKLLKRIIELDPIEKVTGIKIDYDTGQSTPAEGGPQNKVDSVRALVDMRYEKCSRATSPKELDPSSLRDVLKNPATNGRQGRQVDQ
jgi:hypothetical protein